MDDIPAEEEENEYHHHDRACGQDGPFKGFIDANVEDSHQILFFDLLDILSDPVKNDDGVIGPQPQGGDTFLPVNPDPDESFQKGEAYSTIGAIAWLQLAYAEEWQKERSPYRKPISTTGFVACFPPYHHSGSMLSDLFLHTP